MREGGDEVASAGRTVKKSQRVAWQTTGRIHRPSPGMIRPRRLLLRHDLAGGR
jgi:hypothetical protein